MKQVIDLSDYEKELNLLERLQNEAEARREICGYLVDIGENKTENYELYFQEYLQYRMAFNMEKQRFVKDEVFNGDFGKAKNWSIDYADKTITIEI